MEEQFDQLFDRPVLELLRNYWWAAAIVGVLFLLLLWAVVERIARLFRRRRNVPRDEERRLEENLGEYPPPPGPPGSRRLLVEGWPARVRLVVIAPVGKESRVEVSQVESALDQIFRGLGEIVRRDHPRIRLWPPQLSSHGFAPTFHRLTHKPEPGGEPSRWVLIAGQTPSRPRPLLLGLALWADEANTLGQLTLEPAQWTNVLTTKIVDQPGS
ncbi:MAG TPA: hypothetical protein VKI65_17610 [Gemmataceae bacterium]|nr:hypothetical protein [Gemmataceae bacterium]